MASADTKTVRVGISPTPARTKPPPGLLQMYPLGDPPTMMFWPLDANPARIGRGDACAVPVRDEAASRQHALLQRLDGDWEIVDCDSANGLFVDGRKVPRAKLRGGEVIRVGGSLLRFLVTGTADSYHRHAVRADGFVSGPALEPIHDLLERAAGSAISVLIRGETGTGKELAARRLHDAGHRASGPFVAVNCAAIPRDMVESELFGHVRGAFTGAAADSPGLLRQAHGGTLCLDEIGELPLESQAKLLRVLQDRRVRPLGGQAEVPVDLRLVSVTNADLPAGVERGAFRPELYARIAELVVELPPLRERVEDIPLLAAHFLRKHGDPQRMLSPTALELLCTRHWRYNVRELESAIRRALLLAGTTSCLDVQHFVFEATPNGPLPTTKAARGITEEAERDELAAVLREHAGNADAAASALGISRSQLYRRAKRLRLRVSDFKPDEEP